MNSIKFFIYHIEKKWILERHSVKNHQPRVDEIGVYETYDEARGVYLWHMESYTEAEELGQ